MRAKLMDLTCKEKLDVLFFQGTTLSKQTNFNIKFYNGLFKEGHTIYRAHGGGEVLSLETCPYQKITLDTLLQAIATRINIGSDVTIASIYKSRSHDISESLLSTHFQQLNIDRRFQQLSSKM